MAQKHGKLVEIGIPDVGNPTFPGNLLRKGVGVLSVSSRQTGDAIIHVHVESISPHCEPSRSGDQCHSTAGGLKAGSEPVVLVRNLNVLSVLRLPDIDGEKSACRLRGTRLFHNLRADRRHAFVPVTGNSDVLADAGHVGSLFIQPFLRAVRTLHLLHSLSFQRACATRL